MMEFGLGLWGMQATRMAPRHHVNLYQEMIEDCQYAEQLGFHSLWLTEHHFWYDGYCPSLVVGLGALAAATSRIKLATGMVLLPMHDPVRAAEQAAVADLLSNGRTLLGYANGYRDVEFDGLGLRRKDRGARLTEQFNILKLAWTQERFSFAGKHFKYDNLAITPKPLQKPHPPVFVGTSPLYSPAVARAGKFGFGLLVPPTLAPAQCREAIGIWEKTARAAGHDVDKLRKEKIAPMGLVYDLWVDETNHKAETIIPNLRYLYQEQLGGWRFLVDAEGKPVGFDRRDILNQAVESVVSTAAIGSPTKVIRQLKQYEEAGIDFFCARVRWDSTPREDLHRCMRLLAKEVVPAFA
jgi:alkanesulfonate monooxygenase SsuD/methylene tetrahydromethanopterin reductase-like flavin-dependent oxidoreductase (luciferase family)